MYQTNNPIIKHKVGLLNLAEELNNVSKACKIMGVSRDTFYRYQELVNDGGIDALINPRVSHRHIKFQKWLIKAMVNLQVTKTYKFV
ncbi:helix-turn-helix domain-containing protein [Candidatus Arsenophonus triatominarum]|uniref:helix-turn-helix domain-containing protein n=1 Tax=Candidatus Arsenophonus triatominarum TaxID=57911 RepID=UPI000B223EED|nr:helix-turn-helix domain-containing protein [Candidatus Arsenophonus triatominarum]